MLKLSWKNQAQCTSPAPRAIGKLVLWKDWISLGQAGGCGEAALASGELGGAEGGDLTRAGTGVLGGKLIRGSQPAPA